MTADRDMRIKQLFADASARPADQREHFLQQLCGDDGDLCLAVQRLLSADDAVEARFLEGRADPQASSRMTTQIGRFRLVRKIGEGGMGTVFEAEQDQPRRKVALKMVRHANMTKPLLQRFEYEVQILGQLKHPGIAQIYEAGTHDDGTGQVPYFAMELVDGEPLMDFVRQHDCSLRQRLELMVAICDAVHHAHQKGVVHRDLKPANILIEAPADGFFQPKILDFGVARATHWDMELVTMHTEVGQLVGTLSYMSPEQVAGRPDELDIRSDVYTLGVILYELLADRLPYDLHNHSISTAGTIIREHDPTRLSSIDASLRGDAETIVCKALAKERERRYQSAAEFAADIRRFLSDEPIAARPASRAYQMRKFARRNKGLVGGVAVAFVVLLLAVVVVSFALIRATQAERAASRLAATATAVSEFLQNMLAGVDPEEIGPEPLTVREVLDHAAVRIDAQLADQPEVAASVHQTLGTHYSTLGHYIDADRHLQTAVALRRTFTVGDDPELARALSELASNLYNKRDLMEVEAPMREALAMHRRLFGEDSLEVAESLHGLGSVLVEVGRASEAEPLLRQALDIQQRLLGPEHNDVATSMGTLAWCLQALGRLDEAEIAMRDAVEMVRRLPGDHERSLAARLTFLTSLFRAKGMDAEEETALREAIEIRSRRLAEDHPALAWNLFCLARVRLKQGDFVEAERACRRSLDIYLKRRGPQHADVADCQQLLAQIYDAQARFAEAEPWWMACLEMRRVLLPADHPEIEFAENALARNKAAQTGPLSTPGP